jgi:hypothetical protein
LNINGPWNSRVGRVSADLTAPSAIRPTPITLGHRVGAMAIHATRGRVPLGSQRPHHAHQQLRIDNRLLVRPTPLEQPRLHGLSHLVRHATIMPFE